MIMVILIIYWALVVNINNNWIKIVKRKPNISYNSFVTGRMSTSVCVCMCVLGDYATWEKKKEGKKQRVKNQMFNFLTFTVVFTVPIMIQN